MIEVKDLPKVCPWTGKHFQPAGSSEKFKLLRPALGYVLGHTEGAIAPPVAALLNNPEMLDRVSNALKAEYARGTRRHPASGIADILLAICNKYLIISKNEITSRIELWFAEDGGCRIVGQLPDVKTMETAACQVLKLAGVDDAKSISGKYAEYVAEVDSRKTVMEKDRWFCNVVKSFLFSEVPAEMKISEVGWTGDPTPTQRRLSTEALDLHTFLGTVTPAWDEITGRMPEKWAFMSWVWSLFSGDLSTRQVCWLHGTGNDGKSTITNVLVDVLGPHIVSVFSMDGPPNQFTNYKFYRKRLAIAPDVKSSNFLTNELVFKITGGDSLDIEGKGRDSFAAKVNAHFLVGANVAPYINVYSAAYKSRLLYIKVLPIPVRDVTTFADASFETRLKNEIYPFLAKCRDVHSRIAGESNRVTPSPEMEADITTHCRHPLLGVCERFCEETLSFGKGKSLHKLDARPQFQTILKKYAYPHYFSFAMSMLVDYMIATKECYLENEYIMGVEISE